MRAGILSMQRVNNFGSLLQAYSLKKYLEGFGFETTFIDIKKNDAENSILGNNKLDFTMEIEKTDLFAKIKKLNKYTFNRINNKRGELVQRLLFQKFREQYLDIDISYENYDLCIIGSDEVFNCLSDGEWGFTSQLFGNIPEAKKIVTYAASCGATTINQVPKEIKSIIQKSFYNIDNFSVRDQNTFNFVKELSNKPVQKNVDPVIIYDFFNEMNKESLPDLPKKYCVIYSYRNRIKNKEEIKSIMKFCDSHHLVPISVGAPQYWVKHFVPCNPFQCLKIFSEADFIITDTFHGTIFSLKYAKKFATVIRESNNNKLSDLIDTFDIQDHVLSDFEKLESIYLINKKESIPTKINEETTKAVSYFDEIRKQYEK